MKLTLTLCIAALLSLRANAAEFFVAPNGSDVNPGTDSQPFATLAKARDAARTAKAADASAKRRIVVRGGEYFLDATLELTAQDSGLTIEAAPGEKPMLYGGRRITGWQRDGEKFWSVDLPEVKAGKWDFRMLVVNGRMCSRARLPQTGEFKHLTESKSKWRVGPHFDFEPKPTKEELSTIVYRPDDLGPWLDIKNAELSVYHMWSDSVVGLAAMDVPKHTLTFSSPCIMPPGAFKVQKYVVWNVREGLTEPGQWYLDRTAGKVVYWPLKGEPMEKADVLAPTMASVIHIQGSKEKRAQDIALRGLTVSVTNARLQVGFGAINVDRADYCTLEKLTVVRVAGIGIETGKGAVPFATDVIGARIEGCEVSETGAGGIKVTGTDCVVSNNHVHHVGRIKPGCVGISSNSEGSGRNVIAHNEIHDTPYCGIGARGDGLRIESNRIYRVMQVLHDGAGIYVFNKNKNVVLRGNFVSDIVDTGGYGASSYYLDALNTEALLEGNLSVGVVRPLMCNIGERNVIRGNVFINDGDMDLYFPRSKDHRFEHNVVWAKGHIAFFPINAVTEASGNVLFSEVGKVEGNKVKVVGNVLPESAGVEPLVTDARWTLADPKLGEFKSGKVSYATDSPAVKLGISPIDVSKAGRTAPQH